MSEDLPIFSDLSRHDRLRLLRELQSTKGWSVFLQPYLARREETALQNVRTAKAGDDLLVARETWKFLESLTNLVSDTINTLEVEEAQERT